jgi:hypothetical protein
MTDRQPLIAFGLLLFAICYLATVAAWLAAQLATAAMARICPIVP